MKKIKITPFNFIVFLSAVAFAVMFLLDWRQSVIVYVIQPILAVAIWGYLIFYRNFPEYIIKNMRIPDIILAILGVIGFCAKRYEIIIEFSERTKVAMASTIESSSVISFVMENVSFFVCCGLVVISLALFLILTWLFIKVRPVVADLFKKMDKTELTFICTFSMIIFFFSAFLFTQTTIFYLPPNADAIYVSDTGPIVEGDAYLYPQHGENDVRQILFGVFAMPFASIIKTVSLPFQIFWLYPLLLNFLQIFLLAISIVLIVKMLKIGGAVRKFLILMLFASTYSVILFCFMMEQYIFAVWWLTLFLFFTIENKKVNIPLLVAASGSLITSIVVALPFVVYYRKVKDVITDACMFVLIFFSCITVFGLFSLFFNSSSQAVWLVTEFGGKSLTVMDKLYQFTAFIPNMFTAPDFFTTYNLLGAPQIVLSVYSTVNYFGVGIFLMSVVGFCIDGKNIFKKTCFIWMLFSVLLLLFFGYGAQENGMVLYSLYFLWAFMVLMVTLINRLFGKLPVIEYGIYIIAIGYMLYCNIRGMIDIFHFGVKNYPL